MSRTLLVGILLGAVACVYAPSLGAQSPPTAGALAGQITCQEGQPRVTPYDRRAAEYGISAEENALHEATHLQQLTGACDSTLAAWARDPVARLEAEVEATCAGFAAVPITRRRARRGDAMRVLFALYGPSLPASPPPFEVVYDAFDRWCGS